MTGVFLVNSYNICFVPEIANILVFYTTDFFLGGGKLLTNQPIFLETLEVRPLSSSKSLVIDVAVLFTDRTCNLRDMIQSTPLNY